MINIDEKRCTGCSYCQAICPVQAITLDIQVDARPVIDSERCVLCGECIYVCPNQAFSSAEISNRPIELDKHYDVIVIGAGIGGLLAAAGCAKGGKKVLLLEQLSFIGGKYTHLMYQDYAVTTAAWTCPGPNSFVGQLTLKLGAQLDWLTVKDLGIPNGNSYGHRVVTRDGLSFNCLDDAQKALAGGKKGMQAVYRWIADMFDPESTYPDSVSSRDYLRKFIPDRPQYEDYVETIITHSFASQTLDNFPAMEIKKAIVSSIEQMAQWGTARGGTAALVKAIETVLLKYEGQIALRTPVSRINISENQVNGVTLADGRVISADIVIHNAGLNRLMTLAGVEHFPTDYINRLKSAVPAKVAALILGTSRPLLDPDHSTFHTMGWERKFNCYAPTYFDPSLAPEGKHILDVFWVMKEPINKKDELDLAYKQLHELFPDFDQVVTMQLPMFFHGNWTAEMAHRKDQSGANRLNPITPVKNLYMVGYDCIGYGMAGDIIPHGVERVLYQILNDPTYRPYEEKASVRRSHWLKSLGFKGLALLSGF